MLALDSPPLCCFQTGRLPAAGEDGTSRTVQPGAAELLHHNYAVRPHLRGTGVERRAVHDAPLHGVLVYVYLFALLSQLLASTMNMPVGTLLQLFSVSLDNVQSVLLSVSLSFPLSLYLCPFPILNSTSSILSPAFCLPAFIHPLFVLPVLFSLLTPLSACVIRCLG